MTAVKQAIYEANNTETNTSVESMKKIRIIAGKLFDPETLEFLENRVITVSEDTGLIHDVQRLSEVLDLDLTSSLTIDLRASTVLPGFVDTHVHCA